MMARLVVHRDAEADLIAIARTNAEEAAHIGVFLEELNGDLDLLDMLSGGAGENCSMSVGPFYRLRNRGFEVKRVKIRSLEAAENWSDYRILVVHDGSASLVWILGIVHRSFKYDPKHPISARIAAQCERLGLGIRPSRSH